MSSTEKQALRQRLDEFYGNVNDYTAFAMPSHQVQCWEHIASDIRRRLTGAPDEVILDVLEIGAGRSGFGEWLTAEQLRHKVRWTAQDITAQNADWLERQTDAVIYGDVSSIPGLERFDVVFSTYVLEHVTDPAAHLQHLYKLLRPGGRLFLFCPRYDLPSYLCPSCRHLSRTVRLRFGIRCVLARIRSWIRRRPAFLLQTDLAAFHRPFFTDADAVHWVSLIDLQIWALNKRAQFRRLKVGQPSIGSKDWVVKRWLTCAVEISKDHA